MNLFIVVILSVSLAILYVLHRNYSGKIFGTNDADTAVGIRKEYFYIQIVIGILTSAICLVTMSFEDFRLNTITIGFICSWAGYLTSTFLSLPVSNKRPIDIPNTEKFILYLRGFSVDSYEGIKPLQKRMSFDSFSEYHFISILKKYLPVYSVGMTKELSAPLGATRIYLNDIEWEKDVHDLIERAELVVVLVNDSDSCLWEIENCVNLTKTILIVDNQEKLLAVRGHLAKKHLYPFPILISSHSILYHTDSHGEYVAIHYENTEKSYLKITKKIMKERYGVCRWTINRWQLRLFQILLVIILFPIIFLLSVSRVSNAELMLYVLGGVFFFIIIYLLYATPISKWKNFKSKIK